MAFDFATFLSTVPAILDARLLSLSVVATVSASPRWSTDRQAARSARCRAACQPDD